MPPRNRRYENVILKINPTDGFVVKKYDFSNLYPEHLRSRKSDDCLNGIAYNASSREFIITGKRWPKYYVVQLEDSPSDGSPELR
jgi:glutamine cyclotransferase